MRTREASTISPDYLLGRGLEYLPNEVKGHIAEALTAMHPDIKYYMHYYR